MTDKKTTDDDAEKAAGSSPITAQDEARVPETVDDALSAPSDQPDGAVPDGAVPDAVVADDVAGDSNKTDTEIADEDDAPVKDPWDDPEDALAEDVLTSADPQKTEAKPGEEPAEDHELHDEHHEEFEDAPGPSLAARALRALVIALIGGGAALWAAPKVAPMLPASVSRLLVVAVPVEVSEFNTYRDQASARIAGLEAALDDRAQTLGAKIETAGKSGLTGDEVDAVVAEAMTTLSARMTALGETLANGDLSGLAARLATLETQTAGLTRQLDSLAGGLKSIGAETGSVGEMSQAAVARLAANAAQIDGLRGQIDQMSQQTGALTQRLEQAETDAAARTADAEASADKRATDAAQAADDAKLAAEARAHIATINAAFDEIAASIDIGAPFADVLARVDAEAPTTLATAANDGVPTNAALRVAFTPAAHAAIRADALAKADGGAFDKLVAGVAAQFTGVPTVATGGSDVAAILGEGSSKLDDDDVAGAIDALTRLSLDAAAPLANWIAQATLRRDAKSALADWRAALTKTDG
ncbi:MAG: TolA-binding protein [Paracoccaceae bacterium]|jgi:TolA-binding protein